MLIEQMSSNFFAVHGDHTENGMPIFAGDPHIVNFLPAAWIMFNLRTEDGEALSGFNFQGIPFIAIGRSNNIAWSFTTSRADSSDVWEEKLSDDGNSYMVDNEWRQFEKIEETIKVMGGEDIHYTIKKTHRGVLLPFELIRHNFALINAFDMPNSL